MAGGPAGLVSSGDALHGLGGVRTVEPVAEHALSFAGLLRQLRTEARLTQEELAEAAGAEPAVGQ